MSPSSAREGGVMAVHQIPQSGGRGERGKAPDSTSKTLDGPPTPTQTPPTSDKPPTVVRPLAEPPQQPGPRESPTLLYLLVAGLVLLAAWLAWLSYKLKLRLRLEEAKTKGEFLGRIPLGPMPVLATPSAVQAGAVKGVKEFKLDERQKWKPYLMPQGVLANTLEPVLVQQLDKTDLGEAFYYLVPLGRDLASAKAVACVDGVTGEYLECTRFEAKEAEGARGTGTWGQRFAMWETVASTRATLAAGKIDLRLEAGTSVRETEIGVHPHLVWMPCVESQSVFLPFRLVKVGNEVRYIRVDGKVFDKLTG